jgi:hypothetical protein
VAVLAGVVIAVAARSGGGGSPAAALSATPTGASTATLDLASARPAEEVWPDAVVRLPLRLPDGRAFTPKARLDDDRYLGIPNRGNAFEPPVVFDVDAGEVDELITARPSEDMVFGPPVVSVSQRVIVVALTSRPATGDADESAAEVWVAPRSGGRATRRAEFETGTEVSPFAVGDAVYATVTSKRERTTTVYRLPAGGSPEQVARAERVPHSPYGRWFMTGPSTDSPDASPSAPATFEDVVTGESRTTTVFDGLTDIVCSPETCVGHDDAGLVAYRFDGTNPTRIKGVVAREHPPFITETGRFIRLQSRLDVYLWDREKAVVVAVHGDRSNDGQLQECRFSDDEQILIDLSLIP